MELLKKIQGVQRFKAASSSLPYVAALDGLRAIAVTSVVFGHFGVPGFSGGGYGVDVFFVLSGYLISRLILQLLASGKHLSGFYWNRYTRLFPPLLVVGLSLFALPPSWLTSWGAFLNLVGALCYVTNWTRAFPTLGWPNFMAHTWSLSVEEQFYLVWPGVLYIVTRYLRCARTMIVSLAGVSLAWFGGLVYLGASHDRIYNGFDGHCPPLLLGACLAFLPKVRCSEPIAAIAFVAYVVIVFTQTWEPISAVLIWIAALAMIAHACDADATGVIRRFLSWSPVVYLGAISYEIYLWHWPIYYALVQRMRLPTFPAGVLGISLSLILSVLTAVLIGGPSRCFRDAWEPAERDLFGRALAAWTLAALVGGLVFFYGGFIKASPY